MGEGEGGEENGLAVAELGDHNQRFLPALMESHPLKAGFLHLNVMRLGTACLEVVGPVRMANRKVLFRKSAANSRRDAGICYRATNLGFALVC